ncbi:MAG: NAD(P)H-dependent oxidoreductase [Candidatus Heimdallarchaeaceae archaeon]
MKNLPTPLEVLENMFSYIIENYPAKEEKEEGTIQFFLAHKGEEIECYIEANSKELIFSEGIIKNPTVTLWSTLYNWLDLAANRLNPVKGVMTKKLKFKGDTSFFSNALSGDLYEVDVSKYDDPVTDFERTPSKHWKKPSKTLVISASPRGEKGYTYFYLNAFLKGLERDGNKVEIVSLNKLNINDCKGCWHCWLSGTGKCVYSEKDDVKELYDKMNEADLIVFAFPLYAGGIPGILKNFFDRGVIQLHPYMVKGLHAIRHPRRIKKDQAAVVLTICGFPEIGQLDAVKAYFEDWSHNGHIPIIAEILRPGCMEIYNNPLHYQLLNSVMESLEEAGKELFENGEIDKKLLDSISQAGSTSEEFVANSNPFWFNKIERNEKTY